MIIDVNGNLGKDMELKTYKDGGQYIDCSLGYNVKKKDLSGSWVTTDTIWFNVYIREPKLLAQFKDKPLKKGTKVDVKGRFTIGKKKSDDSPLYSISLSNGDDLLYVSQGFNNNKSQYSYKQNNLEWGI